MKRLIIAAALGATAIVGAASAQTPTQAGSAAPRGVAAADLNGDGIVTRAEATAAADTMFARVDKNRDGKISADERPGRRGAMAGDMTQQQFRERFLQRFDRADANKDGRLDQSERQNMGTKRGDRRGGMAHRGGAGHRGGMGMMMHADANRDGILTKAEALAAAGAMFDRVDSNKDGRVDQAERDAARAHMKGKWAQGRNAPAAK